MSAVPRPKRSSLKEGSSGIQRQKKKVPLLFHGAVNGRDESGHVVGGVNDHVFRKRTPRPKALISPVDVLHLRTKQNEKSSLSFVRNGDGDRSIFQEIKLNFFEADESVEIV